MDPIAASIISAIIGIAASSGFWSFLQHRHDHKSATKRLLLGLAHDRILFLGSSYVNRGYITKEEYDDLNSYLYEPYKEAGGNGSAEKIMNEVNKLPTYKPIFLPKDEHEEYLHKKGE